ncbi:hypothetical protein D7Y13_39570 [Corallococcus praedator]|uniref:Uncharacterized protein n=1 Tax=Corallococcus praedator TaxID=2316724 RepID=A0ABX9Q807_9BACT|nr:MULTISPECIES: hypothetical protein [Corallococcus]RKG95976.1 hypothetical protein D7X74_41730 [Corallococcus sp. CA047B]RKH17737.1 hypothetical protein D7X75_40110 [Corallococcus sp. CA031C]RKH90656.1 hypothetical protein D7Y13_39570 [Corallococcus praedator]
MLRSRSSVFVLLALGLGGSGCYAPNHQPVITAGPRPLGSPSTVGGLKFEEGTVIQLQLEVKDADDDEIFYLWSQVPVNPAGTFSSTTVGTPTWTVPPPPENPNQAIHLNVEVKDGNGGVLLGQSPDIYVIPKQ